MMQGKTVIIVLVALIVGFGAGIVLRPVIIPAPQTAAIAAPPLAAPAPAEARSTQYFAAHLDEGRRIVADCAQGTVRGDECANAEQAVTEADGRDRFKRFMGK
jgi:hypothetical protein